MFKRLQSFLLLLAMLGLWAAQPAAASHLQGGDLTYASLGNNRYRVTLHLYRDCSGITPSQFTLECRSGGCSTAATVSAPMTQVGGTTVGRQYCATISGLCTAGGPANSETYTYVAEVTLAPAQRWVLSTFQNARPTTANLDAGASSGDLYFEATLNNLVPLAGTTGTVITNNSPVASAQPVAFIPVNRMSNVSNSAFDVDGDSLVYSLETPLASCNVPANYAPYPNASGGMTPISTNPLCVLQAPQITTYTATLPILVAYDTLGSCPIKTAVPRFRFDASTGSITLEPSRYLNTPSSQGENKYAAVVKITEFRRLNGRFVEIGSMRRELYFIVYDCGTNVIPRLTPSVTVQRGLGTGAQSVVQPFGQYISVVAGEPVSVLVNATDANPAQTLTLNLDYNAMPGAVLQNLGGGQARLTFTP
ncbi:MAG: gliding motility-associated C-terminal protein, partial [Hymenobacter sp.]|nr:gliding motility-associated C-terminal protein [Hymenobacter sp.]